MTSRGISMEALLTSSGKCNRNIAVVQALKCQKMEAFETSSITFVGAFNNEMIGVSNLSSNHETGTHTITRHVGDLVSNSGVHGFIVTIDWENITFNHHTRESGGHFLIVGDRQC